MSTPGPWIKAAMSGSGSQCVEMRRNGQAVELRDSKAGDKGPILAFTSAEIEAWVNGAKKGEFDHLISG
ncbi:MAG TPA: DUF397 domain-containing protein [Polyangia bacterium]